MSERTVLLIDDDPGIHRLVEHFLVGMLDSVWVASDAREGLAMARDRSPSLILLDIELPDLDGIEVFRALRTSSETAEIPVLFLTARSDQVSMISALEAGAIDYITKPFEAPVFQARVRSALKRGTTEKSCGLDSVLVVDDDPNIHRLVASFLNGITTVHHAYGAAAAIETAKRLQPSVVLLDLDLPDTHGFQVCRELRSNRETAEIPVVILTSDSGQHRMAAGLDHGAVDYLRKPIDSELLIARLHTATRRSTPTS